jgi:hypothetical protein
MQGKSKSATCMAAMIVSACLLAVLVLPSRGAAQSAEAMRSLEAKAIDAKIQGEIIDSISAALNEVYVFPEVAKKMEEHIRGKLKGKEYDKIKTLGEFTGKLTEDLREISKDLHLGVRPSPPDEIAGSEADTLTDEMRQKQFEEYSYFNFGFVKAERLNGNIGYLDFRQFNNAYYGGQTAIAALNFLAYTDALIIDLRQNGGGSPSMIQLITSYFFDEPVHLNSFYVRKTDSIEQFWTQASVSGKRMSDVDLYVLTSRSTFSGAEEFTYNLKNLKRATIVGETTGGGAHPVEGRGFRNLNVVMSLPFGRAINPITGTNWEGVGVTPDIEVPQKDALDVAYKEALKKILEKSDDERIKAEVEWTIADLEAKLNPVEVGPEILKKYAGVYGPRTITFENGKLYYQREERPKYRMIPMARDLFMFDEIDYFRIKVITDEKGIGIELNGLYRGGHVDKSYRDSRK